MELNKTELFKNIESHDLPTLLKCLNARQKIYKAGELVSPQNEKNETMVGLILSGSANLVREDRSGNSTLISMLYAGDTFGEVLSSAKAAMPGLMLECTDNCSILFIDFQDITKRCERACIFHSQLVENMMGIVAKKAIELNGKVELLSCRTIREKLICYLSKMAAKCGKPSFNVALSRTQLADYLCVDRSAMTRELCKMQSEGLIGFEKERFTLLQPEYFDY